MVEVKEMEGKWMVLDEGDIAWFYKIENGEPKLKANWMVGSLGLINENKKMERKVEDLEVVPEVMEKLLNQLNKEGKAFWAMEGTLKRPFPYQQPYGTLEEKGE